MKITYSILWFDDTDEYYESLDLDGLKEKIESWGFDPIISLASDPDDFMSHAPFHDIDLIVVDYNLEEYGHGEEFIKKIRDHDVYTEVIFYSANPAAQLWAAIKEKMLEGVFVANRGGEITKIEKVAEQSVRKMLDLENVRGIVMAEVGNIDHKLENIIHASITKLDDTEQSKIYEKYKARIIDYSQSTIDKVASIDDRCMASLLSYCDSNKKWNLFQSIAKKHPDIKHGDIGDYASSILKPRNFLAHGVPMKQEDGSVLFSHNGNEFRFDESVSAALRNDLQGYCKVFDDVLAKLDS